MTRARTLLAASTLTAGLAPTSAAPPWQEGEPFPDLLLPALSDGRPASLADFRGRKVVLQVFASW